MRTVVGVAKVVGTGELPGLERFCQKHCEYATPQVSVIYG